MNDHLAAWLAAHGIVLSGVVSALIGFVFRHYWPKAKAWITGAGTDAVVMKALVEFKILLQKSGASEEEIRAIEGLAAQVALRAAQDIEKDATPPPPAK